MNTDFINAMYADMSINCKQTTQAHAGHIALTAHGAVALTAKATIIALTSANNDRIIMSDELAMLIIWLAIVVPLCLWSPPF